MVGSSRNSSASPGEDEEEYETADSGVSEQSSTSSSSDNLNNRKRKQDSGGDNAEVILEAGDHVGDDDVSTSGVSSGTVEQPPTNNAVKRHRSISLSQKNQVPKAPKICKRKPKIYKSVVSDIFDGERSGFFEVGLKCLINPFVFRQTDIDSAVFDLSQGVDHNRDISRLVTAHSHPGLYSERHCAQPETGLCGFNDNHLFVIFQPQPWIHDQP